MGDISKINVNGVDYNLKDASSIENLTVNGTVVTLHKRDGTTSDLDIPYKNTQRAFYCSCSSAAATAAKVVSCSDANFIMEIGTIIVVTFSQTNTASSVTLNVNAKGAKNIRVNNANYTGNSSTYCGYASRQIVYMYDGTGWAWIGKSWDNNTTYSVATSTTNGLMSAADKAKLDGIAENATAVNSATLSDWGFKNTEASSTENGLMSSSDKTNLDKFVNGSDILANTNMDNLTQAGLYQAGSSVVTTMTNLPNGITQAIIVEVQCAGSRRLQRIIRVTDPSVMYQRTYTSTYWTNWVKIAFS